MEWFSRGFGVLGGLFESGGNIGRRGRLVLCLCFGVFFNYFFRVESCFSFEFGGSRVIEEFVKLKREEIGKRIEVLSL